MKASWCDNEFVRMKAKFETKKAKLLMELSKVKKELSAATSQVVRAERKASSGIDPTSYDRVIAELTAAKGQKKELENPSNLFS